MALRRQDWMILGGIFTCALTLRIGCLYYFALSRELSPFELSSDDTYHSLALDLLRGSGWSSHLFAARPPLMPLLVAGLYGIFGESHLAVAVANTLLGSATAALAYLVGLRLIHNTPFSVVAGALVAIDPASTAHNINVLAESLANLFIALSVLWLARSVKLQRLSDASLAGLWLGLSVLARPTTIYLFLFCFPIFCSLVRLRWRMYSAFAILPLICVLVWSGRNLSFIGEFTYTTVSTFNMLFYRAASVERWARGGVSPDVVRRQFMLELEERLGSPQEELEVSNFWRNFAPEDGRRVRAMRRIAISVFLEHPFWYIALIPVGLFYMYGFSTLYGAPSLLELIYNLSLYALAGIGLGVIWKRKDWPSFLITLTIIGYVTLATMASQTSGMDTRMRTSTTVCIAVLAAEGVRTLFNRFRRSVPEERVVNY